MKIFLFNNNYYYEIEKLTKIFFPNAKTQEIQGTPENETPPYIFAGVYEQDRNTVIKAAVCTDDFYKETEKAVPSSDDFELTAARLLYDIFTEYTGVNPPWGLLTGVRPIKLFRKLKEEMGQEGAVDYFRNAFCADDEKTALTVETESIESEVLKRTSPESFSLYLSVPFCPSRCSYCSFVSASTERTQKLIAPYTELLCREIEKTAEIVQSLGLTLRSVYMGGGTPTTLSAEQLEDVLGTVRRCFDMSQCCEFTVEAGRPDTITSEKLNALKKVGVDRVSINPQTLNDDILKSIGRRHTTEQFYNSFKLARECGFDHINTDLIAGLPGDTLESFLKTLDGVTKLDPESVTIHTLSMKRASNLTQSGKMIDKQEAETAAAMVSSAGKTLHSSGFRPYYLYRQSRMVGNLENTGWSKPGKEGYYNVFIMDESQTIIACGAGAVTKITMGKDKLERIFNYKYPYEYISSFDEVLKRKEGIKTLYDQLRQFIQTICTDC